MLDCALKISLSKQLFASNITHDVSFYFFFKPVLANSIHMEKAFAYKFLHPWLGTGLLTRYNCGIANIPSVHQERSKDLDSSYILKLKLRLCTKQKEAPIYSIIIANEII